MTEPYMESQMVVHQAVLLITKQSGKKPELQNFQKLRMNLSMT